MGPSTPPSCLAELLTLVRSFFFFWWSRRGEPLLNLGFCSKAQQVFTWGLLFGIGNKALEVLVMKNKSFYMGDFICMMRASYMSCKLYFFLSLDCCLSCTTREVVLADSAAWRLNQPTDFELSAKSGYAVLRGPDLFMGHPECGFWYLLNILF